MFLRWYRRKIAKEVEDKIIHMGECPNSRDIILTIIAPKDYNNKKIPHCNTDCWNKGCGAYHWGEK